jgi:disulfide bond formation protein DsbB
MGLTTRAFAGFVLLASAIVLGAALASQYVGGLAPCELCLLQRWPWSVAIVITIVVVFSGDRAALPWVALLLAVVFAIGSGLAFYHVGVEQHWYPGPTACTASGNRAATVEELRQQLLNQQPVQCDQPAFSLFGVSMAGWNLLASLVMTGLCIAAVRAGRQRSGRATLRRGEA